jgi:hypothetical protein
MMSRALPPDVSGFDQKAELSADERDALTALGSNLYRRRGHESVSSQWTKIQRLLVPLDAARCMLWRQPTSFPQRRAAIDAVGIVLLQSLEEGTAYWGWPEETWARFIGTGWHAFKKRWPKWLDASVRSDVTAYAYLLCKFDAFHCIGGFNRLALADRVFGREAM